MGDAYRDYADLAAHQEEGADYVIESRPGESGVLFLAPHAGKIEVLTGVLASEAAGDDHALYCFKGVKTRKGNWCLHITSTHFDEPRAVAAVSAADRVVAIHGAKEKDLAWVMVGGRDKDLKARMRKQLKAAGFTLRKPDDRRGADSQANICNRGKTGGGVQLELSKKLRNELRKDKARRRQFVDAMRNALVG